MKLYSSKYAPNPKKVRIYLAEKGIDLPIEEVDIIAREHRGDAFRAKNPMATLPVLELDDGRTFAESLAIIEYLEELHPEPSMIGTNPEERMRVRMLERICELGVLFNVSRYLSNTHPFWQQQIEQRTETAALGMRYTHGALKALDGYIGDNTFVAGDRPTIADCTLYATLHFAHTMSMSIDLEKRPNVARWLQMFRARPSAKA